VTEEPLPQVVLRAQSGERDATEELLRRAGLLVVPILRAFCGRRNSVPDLLQDVLLEVWRSLGKLREPDRFRPWLVRIAYAKASDHLRRIYRRRPVKEEADLDRRADSPYREAHQRASYAETIEAVRDAIEALPPRYRDVLRLRIIEGRTVEAVARAAGKKNGTVKSLLSRGVRLRRGRLEGYR